MTGNSTNFISPGWSRKTLMVRTNVGIRARGCFRFLNKCSPSKFGTSWGAPRGMAPCWWTSVAVSLRAAPPCPQRRRVWWLQQMVRTRRQRVRGAGVRAIPRRRRGGRAGGRTRRRPRGVGVAAGFLRPRGVGVAAPAASRGLLRSRGVGSVVREVWG